jgi:transcriptional regulator with AAA-type ATPase domain
MRGAIASLLDGWRWARERTLWNKFAILQDGRFSRLEGRPSVISDFRMLAATNINVKETIGTKVFREGVTPILK